MSAETTRVAARMPLGQQSMGMDRGGWVGGDYLLPAQYLDLVLSRTLTPEKKLLLHMLIDALETLAHIRAGTGLSVASRPVREQTVTWMRSNSEAVWSVLWVLAHLFPANEPAQIRDRLLSLHYRPERVHRGFI